MKNILLIVFVALTSLTSFGQSTAIDSVATDPSFEKDTTAAGILLRQGIALANEKKAREALDTLQKAMDIYEAHKLWEQYKSCVHYTHRPYLNNPQWQEERLGKVEKILQRYRTLYTEQSDEVAELYFLRTIFYSQVKEHELAKENILQSIAIRENILTAGDVRLVRSKGLLGVVYGELGENVKAEEIYSKIINESAPLEELDKNGLNLVLSAMSNLALLKQETSKQDEAALLYEKTIEANLKYGRPEDIASSYYNAGNNYLLMGDLPIAEDYLLKAKTLLIEANGPDYFMLGLPYNALSIVYQQKNDLAQAIAYQEQSLKISTTRFGPEHLRVARAKTFLGSILTDAGAHEKAYLLHTEAKTVFEKNIPGYSHEKIDLYRNLGMHFYETQTAIDSSIFYFILAIENTKAAFGDRHYFLPPIYRFLADCYRKAGQLDIALDYSNKALSSGTYSFNAGTENPFPAVDDFIVTSGGIHGLLSMAHTMEAFWERDKKNEIHLDKAFESYNQIKALDLGMRKKTGRVESDGDDYIVAVKEAIRFSATAYAHNPLPEFLSNCFDWMEQAKGQQLLMAGQDAKALAHANIPGELVEKDKALSSNIVTLEQQLTEALEAGDSAAVFDVRDKQLFDAKREREDFIANLEKAHPAYYETKYEPATTNVKAVKSYLDDKTILVEMAIHEEENTLYFLLLSKDKGTIIAEKLTTGLEQKVRQFDKLLKSHNLLRADRRREFIDLSHELYAQFIQPIEKHLIGKDRLVIIGEGMTNYIPYEALLKSKEDKPYEALDFLINDFEVSYHYSAALFVKSQKIATSFDNELLAFAPVFADKSLSPDLAANARWVQDSTLRAFDGEHFKPLPYSKKEVEGITTSFAEKGKATTVLLHEQANETALASELEKNYRFVHIATHSFANIDYPKFSGIVCAEQKDSTQLADGILYVGEIYNLSIQSDLLVLSSCESGVGKLQAGEGMLGLNRSFVYAGVPNVLYSLWQVPDQSTADLMQQFYREVLAGQSYSTALRKAKLNLLKKAETAAPDIWGAFLLTGR